MNPGKFIDGLGDSNISHGLGYSTDLATVLITAGRPTPTIPGVKIQKNTACYASALSFIIPGIPS